MRRSVFAVMWAMVLLAMLVVASPPAYGQGGGVTSSLTGLVVDSSGGVMPGVDVVVKNNATAGISQAVTDGGGRFSVPALQPGIYTVTVSLAGFKTVVLPDIQVLTATPASVKVVLEIGKIEESVVVTGATEIVQTQTAAVQTTIVVQQIQQLPLVTRTALDYVVNLPGVSTGAGGNSRSSTINGLNNVNINITLDGVNVQDNNNRNGDGFFMYIRPLMDSVEEITVSASTPEAASAAQGAQQIRMTTRSGTNRFSGSVYDTWRNQAGTDEKDTLARNKKPGWLWRLNTPYWFNKRDIPKTNAGDYFIDDIRLSTPGFRVGGPVFKDKLFYFFNWEWFLLPQQVNRTRSILNTDAQAGLFSYPAANGSGTQTVNLFAIAAANGTTAQADPTIAKLLADIRAAALTTGSIQADDENVDLFTYNPAATQKREFPTVRLDYNLTNAHRITFTTRYNMFRSDPDMLNGAEPVFPGFPNSGAQNSDRFMWQGTVRSTLGKNMVNEARVGWSGAFGKGTLFFYDAGAGEFNCSNPGCQSVGGQGYYFNIETAASNIDGAGYVYSASARNSPSWVYQDTLTWLKGKHSISIGGTYSRFKTTNYNAYFVPLIGFSPTSLDTVPYNMLDPTSGNFPGGISTTYANYARDLYWVLTGRVTAITGTAILGPDGKYVYNGDRVRTSAVNEWGFFLSDSWRVKPNLTVNGGLRYELQLPFKTDGVNYARLQDWSMLYGVTGAGSGSVGQGNLFHPGTMTGSKPVLEAYPKGAAGWSTDYNNVAPSIGAAWRPTLTSGFLSKILSADPVFRGGYSLSFSRQGFASFPYGSNPGGTRSATRTTTTGCNGACTIGSDGFPVLLQQTARLFPGTFPETPVYPLTPATNEALYAVYPNLSVPYTHQWSAGFQRELSKTMAVEVRYVGNQNTGQWTTWNLNSSANYSMLAGENGFYDEFRKAQANLRANIIAGNGNNFAYTGAAGTSPLPIFMAYLQGIPLNDARNLVPANYTASQFKSSSWYNSLSMYNPSLTGIAGTGTSGLQNAAFKANAAAAQLPANFFIANPDTYQSSANLTLNSGTETYHGLQLDFRRRMAQGFMLQASYQLALAQGTYNWRSLREDPLPVEGLRTPRHGFKFNFIYELPFGRGKQFGSGVSRGVDILIGGWEIDGVFKFTTGTRFNYGDYRLVGMTDQEFQDMFKFYHRVDANGKERIYMLPEDVINNSILALYTQSPTTVSGYSGTLPTGRYLAPTSGPDCVQYLTGQCPGTSLRRIITGPTFAKLDMSFVKRIAVVKNMRVEARMDLYNITNAINFNALSTTASSVTGWQVTSASRDINASQDAGGRITSFGLRFTW